MNNRNHIDVSEIKIAILGFDENEVSLFNNVIKSAKKKNVILKPIALKNCLTADVVLINCPNINRFNISKSNWEKLNDIPIIAIDKFKLKKYHIDSNKNVNRPIAWSEMLNYIVEVYISSKLKSLSLTLDEFIDDMVIEDDVNFDNYQKDVTKSKLKAQDKNEELSERMKQLEKIETPESEARNQIINNLPTDVGAKTMVMPSINQSKIITKDTTEESLQQTDEDASKKTDKEDDDIYYSTSVYKEAKGGSNYDILLVDDSYSIRNVVSNLITANGFNVQTAATGKEGLVFALDNHYHCVLLDVVLPDEDGYEICKSIKKAKKNLPVIMLTSKSSSYDKIKGTMAGCNAYLTKPTRASTLLETIKSLK